MEEVKKVSVVMCTYNGENILENSWILFWPRRIQFTS